MKYAWIRQHSLDHPVTVLCQFMAVSRSCYYGWLNSPKTEREKEDEKLIKILKILVIIQRKKVKKVLDRVFASKVRSSHAIKVTEHSIFN